MDSQPLDYTMPKTANATFNKPPRLAADSCGYGNGFSGIFLKSDFGVFEKPGLGKFQNSTLASCWSTKKP